MWSIPRKQDKISGTHQCLLAKSFLQRGKTEIL